MDATARLLASGQTPSVGDIAAAADVSRRTVYSYFPSLEQLLLDATVGALSASGIDAALAAVGDQADVRERVDGLARALLKFSGETLPLGRRLIRLTVEQPAGEKVAQQPRRGYRRVEWIERTLEPVRRRLTEEQYDRLVSGLTVLLGWEAMIVLRDVRALDPVEEETVTAWAARALIDAILQESVQA